MGDYPKILFEAKKEFQVILDELSVLCRSHDEYGFHKSHVNDLLRDLKELCSLIEDETRVEFAT